MAATSSDASFTAVPNLSVALESIRHLLALVFLLTSCVATPRSIRAADEPSPAGMPKGYHISDESTSPGGHHAIIQADPDVVDAEKARNFLVTRIIHCWS